MKRGKDVSRWLVLFCGMLLAGWLSSCQKVELPQEKEGATKPTETGNGSSGATDGKPGSQPDEGNPFPPVPSGMRSVAEILSMYGGMDLGKGYAEKVAGYVVGACDGTVNNALFSIDEILTLNVNSNILIADSKWERDVGRCLPVELKKGSELREDANLVDNTEILGQRIGLLGMVKTYFRVVGMKDVEMHEWIADVPEPEPSPDPGPEEKPDTIPVLPPEPEPKPEPIPDENKDTVVVDDSRPVYVPGGRSA